MLGHKSKNSRAPEPANHDVPYMEYAAREKTSWSTSHARGVRDERHTQTPLLCVGALAFRVWGLYLFGKSDTLRSINCLHTCGNPCTRSSRHLGKFVAVFATFGIYVLCVYVTITMITV